MLIRVIAVFTVVSWPHVLAWQDALCTLPTKPVNGRFTMPHRGINGTVNYYCDNGYWYTGTRTRVCQANGQWSGTTGICERVQCPILSDPPHGTVKLTGRHLDDTATVTCNEGYIHTYPEAKTQQCLGNNHWSSRRSECIEVHCPELANPRYGRIQYSGQGYKNTSTIVCLQGYRYTKPEAITRTCQGDNTWSLQFDGVCKQIHCPMLTALPNGHLSSNGTNYGINITITCLPGYIIQGHDILLCQASGAWSEDPGKCVKSAWNPALLSLPVIPVVIIVIVIAAKCYIVRKKPRQRRHDSRTENTSERAPEEVHPLLTPSVKATSTAAAGPSTTGKLRHHCSLILEDEFEAKDTQSPEYLSFVSRMEIGFKTTLEDNGKDASVHITYVSQQKRMLVMDIESQEKVTEDEIKNVLLSETNGPTKHNINIASGTLLFRDDISNALASEIIKVKHLPQNKDIRVDLDSQYVNLKIISQRELTTLARDELERPHNYCFDLERNQKDIIKDEEVISPGDVKKYVLIRGRAGIGKTTLLQRLMWKWALGEWATHFKAFFLLNLRVLMAMTTEITLPHLLSKCTVYRIAATGVTLEMKWLHDHQRHIGFVLDGLDEVHDFKQWWMNKATASSETVKKPLLWAFSLMKRECMKGSTIIVTSRPFVALTEVKSSATKTIEVMGLTRDRVMEFVDRNVGPGRKNMVKQTLINRPILLSVSAITFYCAALCQVLQDDSSVTDKLTTYTQITAFIMEMFLCRTTTMEKASSCLGALCRLAYNGLMQRTKRGVADLTFGSQDMQNLTKDDVDNARQSGLFLQTEIPDQADSKVKKVLGEFVHLSIQEFLAMAGLLMQSPQDVQKDLRTLSTSGQFNMGLLFLYGFAFDTTSEAIHKLTGAIGGSFAISNQVHTMLKNTILDIPDQLQVLQMVHESQSSQIAQNVGLEKFADEVNFSNTKLTVVDVLAIAFLLRNHPSASTICLKDVGLDEVSCKELARFLESNTTVTTVQLYDDGIGDKAVAHLAKALGQNHTLQKLVIESRNLKDPAMRSLAGALKTNKSLTDLRIEGISVNEGGMQQFANALETNDVLTHLKIVSSSLNDDVMALLADALGRKNVLEDLKISSRGVKSKGVESLAAALKKNSSLTRVLLGWPTINSAAADRLIEALNINGAVSLRLEYPDCDQITRKKLQEHKRVQLKML